MNEFFDGIQKRRFVNAVIIATILLAAFLAITTLNAIKQNTYIGKGVYASNVIAVNGKGEVLTKPDISSFSFSVVEEGKTLKVAQDKSSEKMKAIISAIKNAGVDEKDIKTTSYNSYPKYEYTGTACVNGYCPPGKQVLIGYEVSQSITVKVRKVDNAGNVLAKVGELGASNISSLELTVDDIDSVMDEARNMAIADAKAKAKVLSKTLGVRLNKIVNFYESGQNPGPVMYAMGGMEAKSADYAPVPQIPNGENKIVSNVTITYEVE